MRDVIFKIKEANKMKRDRERDRNEQTNANDQTSEPECALFEQFDDSLLFIRDSFEQAIMIINFMPEKRNAQTWPIINEHYKLDWRTFRKWKLGELFRFGIYFHSRTG